MRAKLSVASPVLHTGHFHGTGSSVGDVGVDRCRQGVRIATVSQGNRDGLVARKVPGRPVTLVERAARAKRAGEGRDKDGGADGRPHRNCNGGYPPRLARPSATPPPSPPSPSPYPPQPPPPPPQAPPTHA